MITLSANWLRDRWPNLVANGAVPLPLSRWDDGDAFTLVELGVLPSSNQVTGHLAIGSVDAPESPLEVRLEPAPEGVDDDAKNAFTAPDGTTYVAIGRATGPGASSEMPVQIVEVEAALAERRVALLESQVLKDECVFILGLGTGGIHVTLELAKAGVGRFVLMDGDRLDVGNVARHHAGVSHAGRRKVYAARDLIWEKNPAAEVEFHPTAADHNSEELVQGILDQCDLVVCATDGRPSKLFVNRLAISAGKTALYGGAFRRAYGGQVLRVRPGSSPCYQCFVMSMPEEEADREVASSHDAIEIAYSDRPVPIEPGLALDVAPIALLTARLALHELLRGRPSTLTALDRDFAAPWYLWINRPEPDTPYAAWPPLSESSDEMTILRWYGVFLDRDPGCPACGDFAAAIEEAYGVGTDNASELPEHPSTDLPSLEG